MPNALHLLLNAPEFDFAKHVGATQEQVAAAHARFLAVKPDEMEDYLKALDPVERNLLHRALLVCLRAIDEYAFEERLGLPKEAGGEVLELLRLAALEHHA